MEARELPEDLASELAGRTPIPCDDPRIHAYGVTLEAMARLGRLFDRHLQEACGLSQSWFEALLRIERSGGIMTMSELASQVALSPGGVTRMVDRLVERGLVARHDCPSDRRVQYVVITDQGRGRLAEALEVHIEDLDRHFTGRMTPDERSVLVEIMERLRR
jgi:DNA-binding MarR family transcriptional regulator